MSNIRVKYASWSPWSVLVTNGNTTNLGGVSKEIYDSLGAIFNVNFIATLQEDFVYGTLDSSGKWTGMMGSLQRNESDMSGPFFVNEARGSAVDFSVPFAFSQMAIVSGLVAANREPFLIFKVFALQVWLFTIASIVLASGAAALIYIKFPKSSLKKYKSQVFFKYTWMFYGTLLGKGLGSEKHWFLSRIWMVASFRLLLCIWLIGPALVLMYTYQGAITSTFASEKLKPIVESLEEMLENTDVAPSTFKNSFPSACFKNLKGTRLEPLNDRVHQNLRPPASAGIPEWLDDVEDGNLVFVADAIMMKSLVAARFKQKRRCGIYVTTINFCPAYMSFAFRKGYRPEFQEQFNEKLLWYSEGRLYQRRMLASLADYETCTRATTSTAKPLRIGDLLGVFILYSICVGVSLFVFLLEMFMKLRRNTVVRNSLRPPMKILDLMESSNKSYLKNNKIDLHVSLLKN